MFQIPDKIPLKFISSSGCWVDLFSPNDGNFLTSYQEASESDIEILLENTPNIQSQIAQLKPYERSEILKKVALLIRDHLDFLSLVIAKEGGKPIKDAKVEVTRAAATLELCAEETLRLEGEVIPMERTPTGVDHISFTTRNPIGAVLAISAFNHPLNLIAHQVGCAVGSGCSVVLKPAPATPISAYFLEKFFKEAGLPEKGIRVIHASIPLIETLISSPKFDFVSFIGSAKVGWGIQKLISPGTRLSLEHGGQAPAIVREDAKINEAVKALVKGAFYHAGQVCISTQIIYVHQSIYDEFLNKFSEESLKLIVGDATDEKTDIGPLIRGAEVKRLNSWIEEAISQGAKLISGNKISGPNSQYLCPTVLSEVPINARLMQEEAFGPVVCINSYSNEDALIESINQNEFIFEASLFTQDITHAMRIAKNISAMTFVINNHTAFRVDQMPFGGHKKSGLGLGGVKYSMKEMTRLKQIIIKY